MAEEVKTIKVKNKAGKELEVTEKAFRVVYKAWGYEVAKSTRKSKAE